jgi:hypothetical protein
VVTGTLPSGQQGAPLILQFRRRGGAWTDVASGSTGPGGGYRLAARLTRSGEIRVIVADGPAARTDGSASAPHGFSVGSLLRARALRSSVVQGNPALVAGRLVDAGPGRRVDLQCRAGTGWQTVARTSTEREGAFRLRFTPMAMRPLQLRVRFAGDDDLGPAQTSVGRITVLHNALASWYGPGFYGRPVACGGAPLGYNQLGVAHRTLPCGTAVTLRYRGRSLRVRVIDRGPFVGAREFDLTRATKVRLRFRGVGVVQVSLA